MDLFIGIEGESEGVFEILEEIPFDLQTIKKGNGVVDTYDQYEILDRSIKFKNNEIIDVYCFFTPSTYGYVLEIFQSDKVIFQITSFQNFDTIFITPGGIKVRFYTSKIPNS